MKVQASKDTASCCAMSKTEIALVEVRVLEGKEENVGEIKMAFWRKDI